MFIRADNNWALNIYVEECMLKHELIIIIIISGFGICGAAVVPDSGVGNTWQRLTLVLHEFLSNGLTPSGLHIVISFLTHADHVFLGLLQSLVPGSPNRVMELMHEVARCTCLYLICNVWYLCIWNCIFCCLQCVLGVRNHLSCTKSYLGRLQSCPMGVLYLIHVEHW